MITAREVRERCFCDNSYVDEVLKDIEAKIISKVYDNPDATNIEYKVNDDPFARQIVRALENNGFTVKDVAYESDPQGKKNLIHISIEW